MTGTTKHIFAKERVLTWCEGTCASSFASQPWACSWWGCRMPRYRHAEWLYVPYSKQGGTTRLSSLRTKGLFLLPKKRWQDVSYCMSAAGGQLKQAVYLGQVSRPQFTPSLPDTQNCLLRLILGNPLTSW